MTLCLAVRAVIPKKKTVEALLLYCLFKMFLAPVFVIFVDFMSVSTDYSFNLEVW